MLHRDCLIVDRRVTQSASINSLVYKYNIDARFPLLLVVASKPQQSKILKFKDAVSVCDDARSVTVETQKFKNIEAIIQK